MNTIRKLFVLLCCFALPSCNSTTTPVSLPKQPNIVFILTDDMAAGDLEFMPKTKKLLEQEGASFNQFFVNMSLCCPSRTTILRGQYGHNTQILGNAPPSGGFEKVYKLGLENSTVAVWLQQAGYNTALIGKYLNGYPNPAGKAYIPPGWTEWYSPVEGTPYTEYDYALNENGKIVQYGNKPEDYGTDVFAAKSIDFIERSIEQERPFFAFISVYAPHHPFTPAPRHQNTFKFTKLPRPPSFNEEDIRDKLKTYLWRKPLTEEQIKQLEESYLLRLQSLQAVDEMVANVVSTLKSRDQLDNTYIFFTSDNGFHLGQHRLPQGKNSPYEEDILVPLLVRGPGIQAGIKINELTGNVDLAQTFCDMGGAAPPDFVDGRSLLPLLLGKKVSEWRQAFLIERDLSDDETGWAPTFNVNFKLEPWAPNGLLEPPDSELDGTSTFFRGLRTSQYKYVEFGNGVIHLYDLEKDPYELDNFSATADPTLLEMLHDWLSKLQTCETDACRQYDIKP